MRAVIVGGGPIGDYENIKGYLKQDDFFVYCDCGLDHKDALGKEPCLIVGDFDSHAKPDTDVETIVLPRRKDDTDTVFAVKECLKRGFDEFLIVGALGGRFDHSLANLYLITFIHNRGAKATIVDDMSEMTVVSGEPVTIDKKFKYFSVFNIDGTAKNISITGAKFNLDKAEIKTEYQYGISNEVEGEFATVFVGQGKAVVIKIKKC